MVRFVFISLLALATMSSSLCAAQNADQESKGVRTIVIDAGHGGPRFPGARYGGINEKDINLAVALKLGNMIKQSMPEIKVIYTRTVEKMFSSVLTEDLQARADIANSAHGDLFISIHSNAARSTQTYGTETLIMGETPMETRQNENILFANNREEFLDMSDERTAAVVRAYIQNLQFTYGEYSEAMARLVEKHYARIGRHSRGVRHQPLKVLYATDMPSVLTEIGFMSNPSELKYITSEEGQKKIAGALFGAVVDYIDYVKATLNPDTSTPEKKSTCQDTDKINASNSSAETTIQSAKAVENVSDAAVAEQTKTESAVKAEVAQKTESAKVESAGTTAASVSQKVSGAGHAYSIQVLSSRTRIAITRSSFGDLAPEVMEVMGSGAYPYKYCVGTYQTSSSAQAELRRVREKFKGAFVVEINNGKIK